MADTCLANIETLIIGSSPNELSEKSTSIIYHGNGRLKTWLSMYFHGNNRKVIVDQLLQTIIEKMFIEF